MMVFMFVALLLAPVSITFYYDAHDNWHMINDIVNSVFLCDIVMWFFTGYYDYRTKVIVLDPRIVALCVNQCIVRALTARESSINTSTSISSSIRVNHPSPVTVCVVDVLIVQNCKIHSYLV